MFGEVARPKPATPWWAPLRIRYVPSGRAAMQGITRREGWGGALVNVGFSERFVVWVGLYGKGFYHAFDFPDGFDCFGLG